MAIPFSTVGAVAGCLGLLALGQGIAGQVKPVVQEAPAALTQAQRERIEGAAQASLFGQFRTSLSDFLWLKVDKYVHDGVDIRALTDEEKRSGRFGKVTSHDTHEDGVQEHKGDETTAIVAREYDWRGALGNIEREVQPYQDMRNHKHRSPEEALPLIRMMTVANPKFVNGYTVGSFIIASDRKRLPEALRFLEEGIRNNPESIELESAMAGLLSRKLRRFDEALLHVQRGLSLVAARDTSTLTEDEAQAWQDLLRAGVFCLRESGDYVGAKRYALECLKRFPTDPTGRNFLYELEHGTLKKFKLPPAAAGTPPSPAH